MKHPATGEFMMEVPPHLFQAAASVNGVGVIPREGGLWVTGADMAKITGSGELFIFNEEADPAVRVDYETGFVHCDERGGWGRTYSKSFSDLEDLAEKWGVEFDVGATTREVAEAGYRLMYAQHAVDHGLSPEQYLPMPEHEFLKLAPLPEPEIEGGIYHEELKMMYRGPVHFTREQMIEYGKECAKLNKE